MTIRCLNCGSQVNAIQRKNIGILCPSCYIDFLEEFLGEIQKWKELNKQVLKDQCYNEHLDEWMAKNVLIND